VAQPLNEPTRTVLCVNTGSSSLKFAAFAMPEERRLAEGAVERIGDEEGRAWIRGRGAPLERNSRCADHAAALDLALDLLAEFELARPDAIGHRVVHGGPHHAAPEVVRPELLASLRDLVPIAPLHLPLAIAAMEAMTIRLPDAPQVACFDTAFHATLPEVARRLPLPDRFPDVRRYGFHGLSYESVLAKLGDPPPARLVIAHLGNGASLVAVRDARSIDTTMGLTPTGGIPMGTRSGDLDPGVLVYLQRAHGLSADGIEHIVDSESGLTALGGTSDMKALLGRNDDRARLAVESFAYALKKAIGAYVAALGGIDVLVFTGGIGEHAAEIRHAACEGLGLMGIELDGDRNGRGDSVISSVSSKCVVRVIQADEDLVIARHTLDVILTARRARRARAAPAPSG
jgi:acetate kinase